MPNIHSLLVRLRLERDRLNKAIAALEGMKSLGKPRAQRRLSAAGRARIAAAQRKRWAAFEATRKKR